MPQFSRPSTDTTLGAWEDEAGGVVSIFTHIDEVVRDDLDYITSEFNPTSSPYVTKLSTVTDPNIDTGHIVRFAARKDPISGVALDLDVELRQGYVSEGSPGTLIDATAIVGLSTVFTEFTFEPDGSLITDYSDLFLRLSANQP